MLRSNCWLAIFMFRLQKIDDALAFGKYRLQIVKMALNKTFFTPTMNTVIDQLTAE